MAKPLRVTTVGTGYFSQFHYDAWTRLGVERVAICNRHLPAAREFARNYGFGNSYDDLAVMLDRERPDLLDIITPPATHRDFITTAAERGVNVICQKPFTTSLAEAQSVVELAENAGIQLIVHENFRFQPWYGQLRTMLDHGELGEPYTVSYRLRPGDGQGAGAYLDRQPYFRKMERFLVHETAIHLVDVFRYLFGDVRAVFARLCRRNPVIAGEDGGLIVFEFRSGTQGVFDGNRLADHAAENRRLTMGEMLIEGSRACVRLDGDGRLWKRNHGENSEKLIDYPWDNRGFGGDCVYRLQRHVVESLTGQTPAMNSGRDYLANLRIEEAIYRSHESGTMVTL